MRARPKKRAGVIAAASSISPKERCKSWVKLPLSIWAGILMLSSAGSVWAMGHAGAGDLQEQLSMLMEAAGENRADKVRDLLDAGMPLHIVVSMTVFPKHLAGDIFGIDYAEKSPLYVMARAQKTGVLRLLLERGLSGPAVDNEISQAWCHGVSDNVLRVCVLGGIDFDNFAPCQGPHFRSMRDPYLACGRHVQAMRRVIDNAKEERTEIIEREDIGRKLCAALFFLPKTLVHLIYEYKVCPKKKDIRLIEAPKVAINMPVMLPGEYATWES